MTAIDCQTWVLPELVLNERELRIAVSGLVGRNVGRSTLYGWRKMLGLTQPPYSQSHAITLAFYGRLLRSGMNPEAAFDKTLQLIEEKKL